MSMSKLYTADDAAKIGSRLGVDWQEVNLEEFRMGLEIELEHGLRDQYTNVTGDDEILTGKIALAHLREFPDYYTRLKKLELEADAYWSKVRGTS